MTQFVGVGNMSRWIQREGVERIMPEMIEYLECDFRRWEKLRNTAHRQPHPFWRDRTDAHH